MIRFGPSGNCDAFYADGNKESSQIPQWLDKLGLTAYEYSFSLGKFLTDATSEKIRKEAEKYNVKVSVHAPYYINFCNTSDTSIENNTKFMLNSLYGLQKLGGDHCVFHIGSQMKLTREEALTNLEKNFRDYLAVFDQYPQLHNMYMCPETMGKYSQIGTPQEIFNICTWHPNLVPTLDFGHINCIMQGGLRTQDDYISILQEGIDILGYQKMDNCHIHFSKIRYNSKGEVAHVTFDDTEFGPDYQPMIDAILTLNLHPTIISESKGTQGPDAKTMLDYYLSKQKSR
ncbi:MAG: TIM barrel protein [Clostridia bacterium]|nr:TIM barrel protein [Clostridia bacterium]